MSAAGGGSVLAKRNFREDGDGFVTVRGQRYDDFIEAYVNAASRLFPKALLHWEDFGPSNPGTADLPASRANPPP